MRVAFTNSKQNGSPSPVTDLAPARDRLLKVACELYADDGFHGAHLREICKRAGSNVAVICYHFGSKEGLYQAVLMEAGRRVCAHDGISVASAPWPPEKKLLALVISLLQRLSAEGGWIARLLARELIEPSPCAHNYAASGLEKDFILFQRVMGDCLGSETNSEAVPLHAISLIGECIACSLAGDRLNHPLVQLAGSPKGRTQTARFLTRRALGALERERAHREDPNP